MTPSLPGLLIGALAFAVAFVLVRTLTRRKEQRKRKDQHLAAQKNQSRQVRRARQRKDGN